MDASNYQFGETRLSCGILLSQVIFGSKELHNYGDGAFGPRYGSLGVLHDPPGHIIGHLHWSLQHHIH